MSTVGPLSPSTRQLADDEDDNKITRAENRAGRKIKQKKASVATAQEQKRFKFDGSGNAGGVPEEEPASCVAALHTGRRHAPENSTSTSQQPPSQQQLANKVKSNSDWDMENTDFSLANIADNYFEYEQNGGIQSIKVARRLRNHSAFWRSISPPDNILQVVLYGYVLPFISEPPTMFNKNNKSALNHSDFVTKAIQELCKLGTLEMTKIKPKVVSPLTVSVQSNGKKRLILDLRLVNEYMDKVSVKYEDMRTALMFLRKGGYAFKFDLKSGYHHVDICPEHVTSVS